MNPEDKALLYALAITVALLVTQVTVLQGQIATLEQQITDLQSQIPEPLNYTATGAVSNILIEKFDVIDDANGIIGWPYETDSSTRVKGIWGDISIRTPVEYWHQNWTWVVAFHYDGFNATLALAGTHVSAVSYYEGIVSVSGVIIGNVIEFSYSPMYVNSYYHGGFVLFDEIMPSSEYIVISYLRNP